ncbi:hypothetical protein EIP86_010047 [Pleurotus ostreatoroseus]|nr:hypothetical protein EIP86_010047 [Pleurotus ostreatoroseus]
MLMRLRQTIPHKDELVPELKDAWKECRETFGDNNVVIVSNSAGTYLDPAQVQAESVSYHLAVPVLRHKVFKPSYSCISAVRAYFSSLPKPIRDDELIVVGDRLFTDIVLANRMSRRMPPIPSSPSTTGEAPTQEKIKTRPNHRTSPLSVWTSGVWQKENMVMRAFERGILTGIQRYIAPDNGLHTAVETEKFVKKPPPVEASPIKESLSRRLWNRILK